MGSTRRNFTEEYKDQAVAFVIEGNRSVADVARNIGVHEMTLGRWVKKTRDSQREQIPPDAELTGSERLELIRLRAELPNSRTRRPRSPSCRCRWSLQRKWRPGSRKASSDAPRQEYFDWLQGPFASRTSTRSVRRLFYNRSSPVGRSCQPGSTSRCWSASGSRGRRRRSGRGRGR